MQPFNMQTMTVDLAIHEFNKTNELRQKVLKQGTQNNWGAWKEWLEAEIATIGKCADPTDWHINIIKQYINHWMIVDWLIKDKAAADTKRKATMAALMKDFEGMKNAK